MQEAKKQASFAHAKLAHPRGKLERFPLTIAVGVLGLVQGTQAAGADGDPLRLAVYRDDRLLEIGHPAAVGAAFRVADVMAVLRPFATYLTDCHVTHLFRTDSRWGVDLR